VVPTVARWTVAVLLSLHGLIHLLGAAKGLGLVDVPALTEPIDAASGALWLLAAILVLASAGAVAVGAPTWWWLITGCGAVISQVAIMTSWSDAGAGTVINVLMVLLAAYGYLSLGPTSFQARWQEQATHALTEADPAPPVITETDLDGLPAPVADYIRRSGAVGQPRVTSLHAAFHGRIRSSPDTPWMPFTGEQVNTFGPSPRRLFIMHATRSGLPVTVLHSYTGATATMRAKVLSLVTVVDASGPDMDRGETVTVFNDLVVLAPGAIVGARIRWTAVDDRHVRGVFTNGEQTVSAVISFDDDGDLVDFVSEDRLRASTDGTSFARQRWSTPLSAHREVRGHRLATSGQARWFVPGGGGWFSYVELQFDDIAYNLHGREQPSSRPSLSDSVGHGSR
jgi:hypothetical protein